MEFNSIEFLLFLPLITALYFLDTGKRRWIILLAASYWFYMAWVPKFVILLLVATIIDYLVAIKITSVTEKKTKRLVLLISIFANLGILVLFKYNDFFIENVNEIIEQCGGRSQIPLLRLVLPMGISFYTFQTMAYTIDVYRGNIPAERHLGYFALYVTYFPQLVAGPIERAGHLLSQFKIKTRFTYENVSWGVKQMIWGFFKKVLIADRLAEMVDQVYNSPAQFDGISFIFASYLFAIQIYCDFSGYSDIAIGASRIFGINLMDNFKLPYLANSFNNFWRRWHISLSGWFRDYLYIPLGGSKVTKPRWLLNLFLVFLISGFWHGAAWTYIIWGALHGVYLIVENILPNKDFRQKIPSWITKILVFHLVVFAWIFFRANTLDDSVLIISNLPNWNLEIFLDLINESGYLKFALLMCIVIGFVIIDPKMDKFVKENTLLGYWSNQLLFSFLAALILIFGYFGAAQFIYFQF